MHHQGRTDQRFLLQLEQAWVDGSCRVVYMKDVRTINTTAHRFDHLIGHVACVTILTYLGLVLLATGCAAMSVEPTGAHHHSQEASHSSLCAWSCQMISQSGPAASVPMAVVSFVSAPAMLPHAHPQLHTSVAPRSSRAPPSLSLG